MKSLTRFFALLLVTLTFSIVQANAQSFSDSSSRSPKTIEQQVFKTLIGLPHYGVFDHIAYEVTGDTVTLYGKAASLGLKRNAERAVKKIPGVHGVVNKIDELPLSSFDNSIRRQTVRSFSQHGLYRYLWSNDPSVRIIVENGRITLEGYVSGRGDSNLMNILANSIPGVFKVTNNLVVSNGQPR